MSLFDRIRGWFRRGRQRETSVTNLSRGRVDHVVIIDGSMSSLKPGRESNAGILFKLLAELPPQKRLSLRYEAGIQWRNWRSARDVIEGRGINRQIRRVYGFLASRYRPGDRIFLFGYSRGAYAVRSLAGVIDQVGLLMPEHATVRNIRQAYRHYESSAESAAKQAFKQIYCHPYTEIELVGVWDTVKALGLRLPILWRWTELPHKFHNHHLGRHIRHGFHALALDETREAFAPIMWTTTPEWPGEVQQMWFRGAHGDIGGQIDGFEPARPLANIPLVWMLEKAEQCSLPLPAGWRERFPCDATAPSVGTTRGWGKLFIARRRRLIGRDRSEAVHPSAMPAPDRPDAYGSAAATGQGLD